MTHLKNRSLSSIGILWRIQSHTRHLCRVLILMINFYFYSSLVKPQPGCHIHRLQQLWWNRSAFSSDTHTILQRLSTKCLDHYDQVHHVIYVLTLISCSQNIVSPIMDASMEPIADEMHAGVYLAACVCIAYHNRQQPYYRAILAAVTIQVTQNQMLIQVQCIFTSTKTIRIQTGSPEWQPWLAHSSWALLWVEAFHS